MSQLKIILYHASSDGQRVRETYGSWLDGKPALMIILNDNHYSVYGVRHTDKEGFIETWERIFHSLQMPYGTLNYRIYQNHDKQSGQLQLNNRQQLEELSSNYPKIRGFYLDHGPVKIWGSVNFPQTSEPHIGVGLWQAFEPAGRYDFVRHLTDIKLSDEQVGQIGEFLLDKVKDKYPTQSRTN